MNIQLFDNATVRVDAENLVCITDIYNIVIERGLDGGKLDPRQWARAERNVKSGSTGNIDSVTSSGRQFIDFIAKSLNVAASSIYKTKRGKGGGFRYYSVNVANLPMAQIEKPEPVVAAVQNESKQLGGCDE